MPSSSSTRRVYGTGSIVERSGAFYGRWRIGDQQIQRRLGPVRSSAKPDGLTRKQAEARLRQLMAETVAPSPDRRLTFEIAGAQYLTHLEEVMQRKRTTVQDYRIMLRRHLAPFFGKRALGAIEPVDIGDYIAAKRRAGLAMKTVTNHLQFAHG